MKNDGHGEVVRRRADERKFRVMSVKVIKELGKRMYAQSHIPSENLEV